MRFLFTFTYIYLFCLAHASFAQHSNQSPATWEEYAREKNLSLPVSSLQVLSPEQIGQQLVKSKKLSPSGTARYAPDWCYSTGSIHTLSAGTTHRYYQERYEYVTAREYSITVNEVDATGQFIAELSKGTATISDEDTLVYQIKEKVDGVFKDRIYYKGFYQEQTRQFLPVLTKEFEHYALPRKTGTKVLTYSYHYNHPQQLQFEVLSEDEGTESGQAFYDGIRFKSFQNGSFLAQRSARKGVWEDDEKMEVVQNGSQKTVAHYMTIGPNQWMAISYKTITYNNANQILEEIELEPNGMAMGNSLKRKYIYQAGRLTTVEEYVADEMDNSLWNLKRYDSYTYNTAGQVEEKINTVVYSLSPMVVVPFNRFTYTYYPTGHASAGKMHVELLYTQDGNGGWQPDNRNTYSYSANGKYTSLSREVENNGVWAFSHITNTVVDNRDLVTLEEEINFSEGVEHTFTKKELGYIQCSTISSSPDALPSISTETLALFPNPAQETLSLRLRLSKASEVQITLYTQAGQAVKAERIQTRPSGTHLLTLPVQDLAPGIYLCQVQTADGVHTKKIVKI